MARLGKERPTYERHFHGQNCFVSKMISKESIFGNASQTDGIIPRIDADVFGSFVRCCIEEISLTKAGWRTYRFRGLLPCLSHCERSVREERLRMMPPMPFLDHVENGDFVGALTVIGEPRSDDEDNKALWRAYCLSRLGQHAKAKEIYIDMLSSGENNGDDDCGVSRNTIMLYLSIVYCRLGDFSEAEELALAVDFGDKDDGLIRQESSLRVRILLHIAQRTRDETKVSECRQQLTDSLEDALAAAAVDFSFRNRYEDAAMVYNKILARDGKELALSVFRYIYVAICGLALASSSPNFSPITTILQRSMPLPAGFVRRIPCSW